MNLKKTRLKNIKINISVIILIVTLSLFIGIGVKSITTNLPNQILKSFNQLSRSDKLQTILTFRDQAIEEARQAGDFRCCIDPPCTMCYMEANKWNNFTAGTCACDDLIAKGEEACPQCQRGLADIHDDDNILCDVNSTVSNCQSIIK